MSELTVAGAHVTAIGAHPWRTMLIVNAVVLLGVFLHKINLQPYVPYIHLLVDYHFGFIKRALIGAVVGLFTDKISVTMVYTIASIAWLITAALFLQVFRRTFGLSEKTFPLLVFMAGSPFFLKNFMHSLGHFDIYGCAFALVLLLVPATSLAYVLLAALLSMLLVLIHHIHLLMYVPTIIVIVAIRHYLPHGLTRPNAAPAVLAIVALGALFLAAQFLGTMPVPESDFLAHIKTRMGDPSRTNLLAFSYIWYQPLSKEIADTWARLPSNLLGVPVYALLIWLHAPLWRYFAASLRALASESHRRLVLAGLIGVSLGFLIMYAIVFDYARWTSNWAVCMFLILLAVKTLPAKGEVPLIDGDDRKNRIFGWINTVIPRVGIIRPF